MSQYSSGFPYSPLSANNAAPGAIMSSPYNLETMYPGKWIQLNGRDISSSGFDGAFLNQFPNGVFTSTARTLTATPGSAGISAIGSSPTYFVAAAVAGTTAAQYSTDGITWTQASLVTPASTLVNSIMFCGTRWFFGCSGSTTFCVTTGDNPGSTWTQIAGSGTTTNINSIAYMPSLALTALLPSGTGTTVYTVPDGSTTATARTTNSSTKFGICATSSKFFVLTTTPGSFLQTSTNGTTWVDTSPGDHDCQNALSSIASDGLQTVVISFATYFLVSNDNGASWQKCYPPMEAHMAVSEVANTAAILIRNVFFANGKFFAVFGSAVGTIRSIISKDGRTWFLENIGARGAAGVNFSNIAYKSGVYSAINNSTSALTAVEDSTRFRLPGSVRAPDTTGISNFYDFPSYLRIAT